MVKRFSPKYYSRARRGKAAFKNIPCVTGAEARDTLRVIAQNEPIDENIVYSVLKSVPENGVFDVSDASGNTLYAPSRVSRAVKALVQKGAIVCAEENSQCIDMNSTYRLTNEGVQLKREIVKADQNRIRDYGIY